MKINERLWNQICELTFAVQECREHIWSNKAYALTNYVYYNQKTVTLIVNNNT